LRTTWATVPRTVVTGPTASMRGRIMPLTCADAMPPGRSLCGAVWDTARSADQSRTSCGQDLGHHGGLGLTRRHVWRSPDGGDACRDDDSDGSLSGSRFPGRSGAVGEWGGIGGWVRIGRVTSQPSRAPSCGTPRTSRGSSAYGWAPSAPIGFAGRCPPLTSPSAALSCGDPPRSWSGTARDSGPGRWLAGRCRRAAGAPGANAGGDRVAGPRPPEPL
jgi:hypothetical protein